MTFLKVQTQACGIRLTLDNRDNIVVWTLSRTETAGKHAAAYQIK